MADQLPPAESSRTKRLRWLELRNGGSELTACEPRGGGAGNDANK